MESIDTVNVEKGNLTPSSDIGNYNKNSKSVLSSNSKNPFVWGGIVLFLIVVIGVTGWYFLQEKGPPVNHLIENVPYFGVYHFYPISFKDSGASTLSVLRYYNDERLSFSDVFNALPDVHKDNSESGTSTYGSMRKIFTDNGYEVQAIRFDDAYGNNKNKIGLLKKYIAKNIPVIVIQYERSNTDSLRRRVLVGVFDDREEVVVHDYAFGPNYRMSFKEFDSLFKEGSPNLAVWPSEELSRQLPPPGNKELVNNTPQLDKSLVDTFSNLFELASDARSLAGKAFTLCQSYYPNIPTEDQVIEMLNLYNQSIQLRDEIINDPQFGSMPKIFQFTQKMWRATSVLRTGDITQARNIVLEELIPENHDLDNFFGFELVDSDEFSDERVSTATVFNGKIPYIYEILMNTYRYEGRYQEAINAYQPFFELNPNDEIAIDLLTRIKDPVLRTQTPGSVACFGGKENIR